MDIQFGDQLVQHALDSEIPANRRGSRVRASFDQKPSSTVAGQSVIQIHKPSFLESKGRIQQNGEVEYRETI